MAMLMVVHSARAEYVKLTALAGIDAWSGVGETHESLVDSNIETKWGCWFDPDLSDEESWPTNDNNSSNICYIIVKADKSVVPKWYFLVTANDTERYPNRNWASWKIYGGNFESDNQAVRDVENFIGWTLLDDKQDEFLPTTNFTSVDLQFDYTGSEKFQYFWIEIEKTVEGADVYQQMAEWGLGTYDDIIYSDDNLYYNLNKEEMVAEVTCSPYGGKYEGNIVIPSFIKCNSETYNVTKIGNYAFSGCNGLTSVNIPNSVTTIGNHAFDGCNSLTSITIGNGVIIIDSYAFIGCSNLSSITLPNSLISIGDHAFSSCTGLLSITIPSSVTSIGNSGFAGCSGLTSITIPNNVTSIENSTFENCTSLTTIIIPNSVRSIGDDAFRGCINLTSFIIPSSVTKIGSFAFEGCTNLTSITIPISVTTIAPFAFYSCSGLTSVTIGNNVTSIGNEAFSGCTSLTSITIPSSVTNIGFYAFYNCTSLKDVYCLAAEVPKTDYNAFNGSSIGNATLYVPASALDAYKNIMPWNYFGTIVPIGGIKGDLNDDSKVDIADAVTVLNIMASGEYEKAADINGDNKIDIADFVTILNIMAGQGGEESSSIVGTWVYKWKSSEYEHILKLIFSGSATSGTLKAQEYDGVWDEEICTYTYTGGMSGTLTLIYNGEDYDEEEVVIIKVVSLTAQKLVLEDIPEDGNCTFYRE